MLPQVYPVVVQTFVFQMAITPSFHCGLLSEAIFLGIFKTRTRSFLIIRSIMENIVL